MNFCINSCPWWSYAESMCTPVHIVLNGRYIYIYLWLEPRKRVTVEKDDLTNACCASCIDIQ